MLPWWRSRGTASDRVERLRRRLAGQPGLLWIAAGGLVRALTFELSPWDFTDEVHDVGRPPPEASAWLNCRPGALLCAKAALTPRESGGGTTWRLLWLAFRGGWFYSKAMNCRCLIACTLLGLLAPRFSADALEATTDSILVMTFNLRYASSRPPNSWPERRPVMRDCLREVGPDLIGTQEGLYAQLKDLAADLPDYAWIGTGRDGGSRGEFMAVFYRRERFEPLEFDHFWLSDTPEVIGSSTWGNSNRRMVTWVKFRDQRTHREFYFWNTHLDHQIQLAREKAAALIRQRVEALATRLPVLLVGDFNATAGANPAYDILVKDGGFTDTWLSAAVRRGDEVDTFHNFNGPRAGTNRIDWILSRGPVQTDLTQIVTCHKDGQYPSDHFPVIARVRLGD